MAFKLTKQEDKQRQDIAERLQNAADEVSKGVEAFNEKMSQLFGEHVEHLVVKYNEILTEAREFRDDIVGRFQEEFDDKSERWQEGDTGQSCQELINEWQEIFVDDNDFEILEPELIDDPTKDLEHANNLSEASSERQ